jgi:hypothetical protein
LQESVGGRTPQLATYLHDLASLYHDMGDYASAELLYKQSSDIYKKTLGEEHPDFATV